MNPVWAGISGAILGAAIAAVLPYFITIFVKRTRLVIRERLVYRHPALMGWIEHSHLVEENMDTPALEEVAKAGALLMEGGARGGPAALRRVS